MKHVLGLTFLIFISLFAVAQEPPVCIDGIYPHLAVFNEKHKTERPGETALGAIVPWAGKLWAITYPGHKPFGSSDKLYMVNSDLEMTIHPASVGGTHANRMIHKESNQLIIGPYFISQEGQVRVIDPKVMPGRLTGVARHLTDPANKVYFYTMDEGFYEVNVHTLHVKMLNEDGNARHPVDVAGPLLPGYHGKGAYTSQGRLIIANNGEYHWQSNATSGCLAEWDGQNWKVLENKQFTEVTGPGGLLGDPDESDVVWTTGWDNKSVILKVLDNGQWTDFRLPKASFTYDGKHGWHTEWPRIRETGNEWLMTMHGMFWDFPKTFSASNSAGLKPIASYLKIIPDFAEWNGHLVLACDDASTFDNNFVGQSQSNFWFTTRENIAQLGPRAGYGNLWMNEDVPQGQYSDAFLINGFDRKLIHMAHQSDQPVAFILEVDELGNGQWKDLDRVTVPASGYRYKLFSKMNGQWLRVKTDRDCGKATVAIHLTSKGAQWQTKMPATFESLADVNNTENRQYGLIRPSGENRNLQYEVIQGRSQLWEIDEKMKYHPVADNLQSDWLKEKINLDQRDFEVDEASVILKDKDGARYRLPKTDNRYDHPVDGLWPRGIREVVTERCLLNCHGSFYELPRDISGGIERIKPISTHGKMIMDFCSWRGLMVISGTKERAVPDGHCFVSENDSAALWFGNIDDLWKFGKPVGQGGPWYHTTVEAGEVSDPYLMTGYDKKKMELTADKNVTVVVEVNFDFNGWHQLMVVPVEAEKPFVYQFPEGYSAHWIRLKVDKTCVATANFTYE